LANGCAGPGFQSPAVRRVLAFAAILIGVGLPLALARVAHGDPFERPMSAREWNSVSIAAKARRIPAPVIRSGDWVEVPRWNGYLRLALLGNQDPNGRPYRQTYVRCWSRSGWVHVTRGELGLLGFWLRRSSWVNVPISTCANARKAARGSLSPTAVIALGTVLHETFHRQGILREDHATCLAAVGVWQAVNRHVGEVRADRSWQRVIRWYRRNLDGVYRHGLERCAARRNFVWNDARAWR
jgi:hypothetical protein